MSVTWTAPDGVVYERAGECPPELCQGRCCEFVTFGPFLAQPGAGRWAELHGLDVHEIQVPGTTGTAQMVNIPIPCTALTGEGLCSLHGTEDRPQVCGDWPQSPLDLLETPFCGYSFVPVKEAVHG